MIRKYRENKTTYIRKCEGCGSKFTFQYVDISKNYFIDDKYAIKCPYCETRNKFNFLRKFRGKVSDKE